MPVTGTEEVRALAARLKDADPKVRGEVFKGMRSSARPVVAEIRSTVRASKGSAPRGKVSSAAVERQLHVLARSGGKPLKPLSERQVRSLNKRVAKVTSLRENIASATGSSVSLPADGKSVQLTFRVRSSAMPPSQRKLARRWNRSSGWRHPVFGNRSVWVKQVGGPYFDITIHKHTDDLRRGVTDAMAAAAEKIAHGGTA